MIIISLKYLQLCIVCTLLQAEIGWWTIGCPANGNSGLGTLNDSGRNLVPVHANITKTMES